MIERSRFISRNVILNGKNIGLAVVEINTDGSISIEKFEYETCFTRWTDSHIIIDNNLEPATIQFKNPLKDHDISQ